MTAALFAKKILSRAAHSLGFSYKKLEGAGKDAFLILMYHRVVDHPVARTLGQEGMYVAKETFDLHMRFLKSRFRVIPLEQGFEFLEQKNNVSVANKKPLCAITFDDGWRDVYENAYPLLARHELPATVFLPTGYIGTGKKFWPDRLAFLINKGASKVFKASLPALRETDFHMPRLPESASAPEFHVVVNAMKQLREDDIDKILDAMEQRCGMYSMSEERAFLDWEEVREMHASSLVQFGSHTETHRILTTLSDDEIINELDISKKRLLDAGVAKPEAVAFAYPNGNHTDRIASMVRDAGYRLAVTTEKGWSRAGVGYNPFRLKRIGIHEDITSIDAMFCCRMAEIF